MPHSYSSPLYEPDPLEPSLLFGGAFAPSAAGSAISDSGTASLLFLKACSRCAPIAKPVIGISESNINAAMIAANILMFRFFIAQSSCSYSCAYFLTIIFYPIICRLSSVDCNFNRSTACQSLLIWVIRQSFFLHRYLSTFSFIESDIFLSIGKTGALITRFENSSAFCSVISSASADI